MSYASLACPPRQLLTSGGDFCEMVHLSRRGRHLPIPCRGAERNFSGKRVRITGYKCRRRCARSPAHTTADPLGDSLAVEPRTLTPVALVRIQVPQPACMNRPIDHRVAERTRDRLTPYLRGLRRLIGLDPGDFSRQASLRLHRIEGVLQPQEIAFRQAKKLAQP